jgi:hypothetical protein
MFWIFLNQITFFFNCECFFLVWFLLSTKKNHQNAFMKQEINNPLQNWPYLTHLLFIFHNPQLKSKLRVGLNGF